MFDQFEAQAPLDKESFERQSLALRQQLLEIQFSLENTRHPVIIVLAGLDGAGKGVLVHRLNEWMDPRGIETNTYWEHSDEEESRPYLWRFWRQLPQRGRIGIFLGSWYTQVTQQRVDGTIDDQAVEAFCRRITEFERQLSDDGAIVIKLWLHISQETQRRQLEEKAPRRQQNPRVTDHPYELVGKYQQAMATSKVVIRNTQTFQCPWHIIDGEDRNYREIKAGEIIRDTVIRRIENLEPPAPLEQLPEPQNALASVDLGKSLEKSAYKKQLRKYQAMLQDLAWEGYRQKRSLVAVFEGWDGAGKGSAIRRVTGAIDPRLYKLVQIAAPTDEELAQHYSWRFWRSLQRDGRATLFDRSWYGRVMVERVERFATEAEWSRAYREINEFERELTLHGSIVAKFWIHIDQDEQLTRFRAREQEPYKRHKITDEDWRNREKWPAYETAVNQMIAQTHSEHAPWTLVAGNSKYFARIKILKTLCKAMEQALY
ncbi:polyphosphate:AMP phosphotransferase [Seongchinamella unica]|uniref:Polyphosphate:AMP phosphotransferase n=1 Tax=Seongchinamella unica TaxID=2547392 RepID=A0A4R5LS55_9GAMM|nr:polyphosphate:AMP phosphotransferase [Seongchinamella unica]TDG13680.1 polyphosphate:AMP phosphotransferase [Seongchinamella unica]